MYSLIKDAEETLGQIKQFDSDSKKGVSILQRELSDTNRFPSCYLFKDFWIELSLSTDRSYLKTASKHLLWEALIHSRSQTKTVIAIGSYPTRLEAALKAEQIILRWESLR